MSATAYATDPAPVRRLREKLEESPRAEHFCVTLLGLSTWDSAGLAQAARAARDRIPDATGELALSRKGDGCLLSRVAAPPIAEALAHRHRR